MRFFILFFIFTAPSETEECSVILYILILLVYIYNKKEYNIERFLLVWNPSIYQHFWNIFGKQFVTGKVPKEWLRVTFMT